MSFIPGVGAAAILDADDESSGDESDPNATPNNQPRATAGAADAKAAAAAVTATATAATAASAAPSASDAAALRDAQARAAKSAHFQQLLTTCPALQPANALSAVAGLFFVPDFLSPAEQAAAFAECCAFEGTSASGISGKTGPRVTVFDPYAMPPATTTTAAGTGTGTAAAASAAKADAKTTDTKTAPATAAASATASGASPATATASAAAAASTVSADAADPLSAAALAAGGVGYRASYPHTARSTVFGPAMRALLQRLAARGLVPGAPFQVSVNRYADGAHRMVPHKDGSGCQALIVTLGSGAALEFYAQPESWVVRRTQVYDAHFDALPDKYVASVYQPPGGVLVMAGPAFNDFAHAIEPQAADTLSAKTTANLALLHAADPKRYFAGASIPRGERVSVVMWNE